MNTTEKKNVNAKDIVIIVLVIALIIGLAFSFVSVNNARKAADADSAALKEQLSKLEDQLGGKLDADDAISWEKIQTEIQSALSKVELPDGVTKEDVTKAITEAINSYKGQDITADAIQAMIDSAISKIEIPAGLDKATVEQLIKDAIANIKHPEGLDKATVEKLIKDAIAKIKFPESVDKATVEKLIKDAIAKIEIPEGLDKAAVEKLINDAIAKIEIPESVDKATVEQLIKDAISKIEFPESVDKATVEKIVKDAIAELEGKLDSCVTKEQMEAAIQAALQNVSGGLNEDQVKDIVNNILASFDCGCDHMTKEELEKLIKDIIAGMGGSTPDVPDVPDIPNVPNDVAQVDNAAELTAAANNPSVNTIILEADIPLTEALVFDRDVVIDLNGHKLTTVANVTYPDASTAAINKDCKVTIKNGTINDVAANVDGSSDFIRVFSGATLNLEKVTVNISVSPEVKYNNTMNRWQSNSAEHRIIVIGDGASVNLTDSNINVVSPAVTNFSNYYRYKFAITGVAFSTNANNAKFVMNGGSFEILVTDPVANNNKVETTDILTFVKSDRVRENYANATNTVEIKGNADITVGGPNTKGKVVSSNYLFWLGDGYNSGKTYYSGIKTIDLAVGTNFNTAGVSYTVKTASVLDVEDRCQTYGTNSAVLGIYEIEEIKYHFVCSDKAFGCTYEADLTLAEAAEYTKCPKCGEGTLVLQDN